MADGNESSKLLPTSDPHRDGDVAPTSPDADGALLATQRTPLSVQICAFLAMLSFGCVSSIVTCFLVPLDMQLRRVDRAAVNGAHDVLWIYFAARVVGRQFHSILPLEPRGRGIAGLVTQFIALVTYFVSYFASTPPLTASPWPFAVVLLLSGAAFGVAEVNVISLMSAYGPQSKVAVTVGFIAGWSGLSGLVNTAVLVDDDPKMRVALQATAILVVAAINLFTACMVAMGLPPVPDHIEVFSETFSKFVADCRQWRLWVPKITRDFGTLFAVGFGMTFSYVVLQVYYAKHDRTVLLSGLTLSPLGMMATYAWAGLVFGTAAGLLCLGIVRHHEVNCILSVLAVVLTLTCSPALGILGAVLGVVAMGISTGASSANIDKIVDPEFNLSATSLWLQSWDVGTLLGSALAIPFAVDVARG